MKRAFLGIVLASSALGTANSPVVGRWEGMLGRLPGVTLKVVDHDGQLSGTVTFHVNRDGEVVGSDERTLIHPKFENHVFSFEVNNQNEGQILNSGDGALLRFEMKLTSAGEGDLAKVGGGPKVTMKKVQ